MTEPLAFFASTPDPDVFEPLNTVISKWDPTQLTGPPITGLLTRSALVRMAELGIGASLIKIVFELHSVARLVPTRVTSAVVKQGRRVTLIDVQLMQGEREVARAHAYFTTELQSVEGQLWQPEFPILPPEADELRDVRRQLYYSEASGWTNLASSIQGDARKALWVPGGELIQGEPMTGTLLAGYAADITSLTVNWGTAGMAHINIDASMSLTREPLSDGIGLYTTFTAEGDGIATGSAAVFDRKGPLGVATVSAIAHGVVIDPTSW